MSVLSILKSRIEANGPLSVEDYMATCLYHPEHGYYMTRDPLGSEGDFTTAPEITQIFGEVLGAWVADTWLKMGKPEKWNLLELGPGRGTLMADVLRTLKSALPEAYEGAQITLIEISPTLKIKQRNTLEEHPVCWAKNVDDINFTYPTILLANEVLDAFPTKQFIRKENTFKERMVTLKNGELSFTEGEKAVDLEIDSKGATIVETGDAMESYLCKLKDKMKTGVALFIDYGDEGYGDTLQALKKHKKVDILETPGDADLTTHVNFTNVRKVLGTHNSSLVEPMGIFLTSIGFAARAAHLLTTASTPEQKQSIEQAAHRLLHPEQMGEMFKVVAYRTHEHWPLAGLTFMQQEAVESAA